MQAGLACMLKNPSLRTILLMVCWTYLTIQTVNGACNCTIECTAGCDPGTYYDSGVCAQCPQGKYCPGGSSPATNCPAGTYNNQANKAAESDCQNCLAGTYSSAGSTDCTPCPRGSQCPSDRTATPTNCADGTYSAAGASDCTDCPIGSFCSSTETVTPTLCDIGYYTSSTGQSSCTECPAGFECPSRTAPVQCIAGKYSNVRDGVCTNCPAGQYSSSPGSTGCSQCPEGNECPTDGTSSPVPCGAGYVAAQGSPSCTLCNSDEVPDANQATCEPCPAGKECTNPANTPGDCGSGYYSLLGEAVCTQCPQDHACSSNDQAPVPCGTDEYAAAGSTTCTQCEAGNECSGGVATQCGAGYYSAPGETSCTQCAAGTFCIAGSEAETACEAGSFSSAGSGSCTACPAGSSCTLTTETPCPAGTYSLGSKTTCTDCPAGSQCLVNNAEPTECNTGTYNLLASETACIECPGGYYCADKTVSPVPCITGQISGNGSTSCTDCPAGYACPDIGDPSQNVACAPGSHSAALEIVCTECPPGSYCPITDAALELPCAPGSYSLGNTTVCTPCPAGSICPSTDGSDIETCLPGTYAIAKQTVCTSCKPGYACPDTDSKESIYACPSGMYSIGEQTECTPCSAGFYCPSTQSATEIICEPGMYSVGNQSVCTECPRGKECPDTTQAIENDCDAGYFSLGVQEQCTICPEGYYCEYKTRGGLLCDDGKYSEAGSTICTTCEAGYYCPNTQASYKTECPPGTFSNPGSMQCDNCDKGYICPMQSTTKAPVGTCPQGGYCDGKQWKPCEAGTYNNNTGSATKDECHTCPAGYYCEGQGEIDYSTYDCPVGHYCPQGTTSRTSFPCPGGTYNDVEGMDEMTDCKPCPSRKYCPEASETDGLECPAGFYCAEGQASGYMKPCPVGTYSNTPGLNDSSECTNCPVGHYCPFGNAEDPITAPIPCDPGTYNPDNTSGSVLNCHPCEAGYACPDVGQSNYTLKCKIGHFCPAGTIELDQFPCYAGTYGTMEGLVDASGCEPCPASYICALGTADFGNTANVPEPQPCQSGHYCPAMTTRPDQWPCPAGTFTDRSDLYEESQCTPCTAGYYCSGGDYEVTGICPRGYYCPEGTRFATEFGCPNGTFNDQEGQDEEDDCQYAPQGRYSEFAVSSSTECKQGTYMPNGAPTGTPVFVRDGTGSLSGGTSAKRQFDCLDCPGGSKCGQGTVDPVACGTGMYSAVGQYECKVCEYGYYCDNATTSEDDMYTNKKCPAGRFCVSGLHAEADATDCITGHYCPEATVEELPCPVGTVRKTVGAGAVTDCAPCDAGSYCLEGSSAPNGVCKEGFYCPTNFTNPYGNEPPYIGAYGNEHLPCPEGTYANTTGTPDKESCIECPAGYYCGQATNQPLDCTRGYYCQAGSVKPEPCPMGTYGNRTLLESAEDCTDCDPGYYCDSQGLTQPRDQCDAGYVCYSGAVRSNPTDGTTGELCPRGGFCLTGSYVATPCPLGTYSNVTGAYNNYDCTDCDPGYYCNSVAGGAPTGKCDPGYYCTGRAQVPTQHATEPGYYSLEGSVGQTECEIGSYAPNYSMAACAICPAGFYCDEKAMNFTRSCPAGQYCPEGSYQTYHCPPGTFSNKTHMVAESDCEDCPAGYYCQDRGLTEPTGPCKAGHICYLNALDDDPVFNNDTSGGKTIILYGDSCHPGYYCEEGTATMQACPMGTYRKNYGGTSIDSCTDCDPGKYCNTTAQIDVTGDCTQGYYCTGKAYFPEPVDNVTGNICPQHHICPTGSDVPQTCPIGYYANATGMWECQLCLAGYLCKPEEPPVLCPQGRFCEASTDLIPVTQGTVCPVGTYGAREGLEQESDCTTCDAGYYCDSEGQTNVTGKITAGYFSQGGSTTPTPNNDEYGRTLGLCPKGSYCPEASTNPIPCPAGTYGSSYQLTAEAGCRDCDPGYYCPDLNMTEPVQLCSAGYYCTGKSIEAAPIGQAYGDKCPTGYYCPEGSSDKIPCPPGKFARNEGQDTCDECTQGYYCPENTTEPIECPTGYICPASSSIGTAVPCGVGKFNNLTARYQSTDCVDCTPGYYCASQGLTNPTGECAPGWYCTGGAVADQPAEGDGQGGICTAGNYCPAGSPTQIPCTPGYFCNNDGLEAVNGTCDAGYYCTLSSTMNRPVGETFGDICPAGKFCPAGSPSGQDCPPGTYLDTTGAESEAECLECTQGNFCSGYGNTAVTAACDAGYYCPAGMNVSNPTEYTCPQGHYCPSGSHQEIRCVPGEYQDETGQDSCKTCIAGYYCDNTRDPVVLYNDTVCPEGHYCPAGTQYSTEHKCPKGTYNNNTGLKAESECLPCPGGYYCDQEAQTTFVGLCSPGFYCRLGAESATPMEDDDAYECPAGFFCPEQSSEPQKCPAGTYSNNVRLTAEAECTNCTAGSYCGGLNLTAPSGLCEAGYYCPEGSSSSTQLDCPTGRYCVAGTHTPALCPPGTYSNITNLKDEANCTECTGGYYCETSGLTEPTGLCYEGYYCAPGSIYANASDAFCPVGNFCPEGSSQPTPCRNYTEVDHTHAAECNECPAGYYCTADQQKQQCPRGYYCPNGTGLNWMACPRGTYSNNLGLYEESQCSPCPAGKYCDGEHLTSSTGDCGAGHYCTSGIDRQYPNGINNSVPFNNSCYDDRQVGQGGICPVGHYCPTGSDQPIACPNATYADVEGLSECIQCPAGYYCQIGVSNYTDYPCPSGHYCLAGTIDPNQYPCPAGTFYNQTGAMAEADCFDCTPGSYCETTGRTVPTGPCDGGFFCTGSSPQAAPLVINYGGRCEYGNYCPAGSSSMTPCTPGLYCATDGLSEPSGNCSAGYYCSGSASSAEPTDGTTGNICPVGSYCPAGSAAPTYCIAGTYVNSEGNTDISNCQLCTDGMYCAGSGNSVPDGDCDQGYYCPAGQESATPAGLECTQGHYCPTGSYEPIRCPSGTYQDETGKWFCKGCPAGYYCDSTKSPVVLFNSSECPTGHYCPENSSISTANPCPVGYFNNETMKTQLSDCQQCLGGKYCSQTGLAEPEGDCEAGYYCTIGSDSMTPGLGTDADRCPAGFFCPAGSAMPTSCPQGTYNPTTGRTAESDCTNCTGGYYCPDFNMTAVGPECDAGYYCPTGADSATYIVCPAGSYCPQGSVNPTECAAGTFSSSTALTHQSECDKCTPGYYCPTSGLTAATLECWGGFYCPEEQTGPNPASYICPNGMFCPNGSSIYQQCSDGTYASAQGMSACETCPAGKYCLPVVPANASLNAQDCPEGYFCPAGTGSDWQPCPAGTYSNTPGLSNTSQCLDCDGGQYCNDVHLTAPTGSCAAGYYCTIGVNVQMPNASFTGTGGVCTVGHRCPAGSTIPDPCPAGTYNDMEGQEDCLTCPQGYFCLASADSFSSNPCPVGHYCPNGTEFSTQYKCPAGTYNPLTTSTELGDCADCPGGLYCQGEGQNTWTGNCYAGWYCSGGSDSPNTTTHGGECQPGTYCPEQSSGPTQCPGGKYCQTAGLANYTGDCQAGYFCTLGASVQHPTDGTTGDICPAGSYCPEGSSAPISCGIGTYSPSTGNTDISDCLNCTAGEHCANNSLTATSGDCTAGYYCPEGESTPDRLECTIGHYCPTGSSSPTICPSGEYQDQLGQSSCKPCPGGYYCDNSGGVVTISGAIACPEGYYCPEGTTRADEFPCPLGTFNNMTGLVNSSQCTPCFGGYYCGAVGSTEPTDECQAGFYCKVSAETAAPSQAPDADVCPQGSYCVQGTINPAPCPAGTFGAASGLRMESECTNCTAGSYCETPGLLTVEGPCAAGYYCEEGSNSKRMALCTYGHYCPEGSALPTRCPTGTFNPYEGLNNTDQCTPCSAGRFCETEGLNDTTGPCSAGYYCPEGQNTSTPTDYPCTIGHYCPEASIEPLPCANGTFMNHTHGETCYTCPAGWYCLLGNLVTECPEGYYCPAGTGFDWQQCPPGTYNNETGLTDVSECKSCPGGWYCDSYAATAPTGLCEKGYYCEYGVDRPAPSDCNNTDVGGLCLTAGSQTGIGGVCFNGHYCPEGTTTPLACGQGTFSNVSNLDSCYICPAGYYCVPGSYTFLNTPCPVGHYCLEGTGSPTQYPCPAGTYYNHTHGTNITDCIDCPPGQYCETIGRQEPTGLCAKGYYCEAASTTSTPSDGIEGNYCTAGFYCPEGSSVMTACDPGMYCDSDLLDAPTGNCSGGYYCIGSSASMNPTDNVTGNVCPAGHYCPEQSYMPQPCPEGYFLNDTAQDELADCIICLGGMYCQGTGNEEPTGPCAAGYYCPPGQNVSAPADYNCDVGYYCPGGTAQQIQCDNGYYQDTETQASCDLCDAGHFCDNTGAIWVLGSGSACPKGYYCPNGTSFGSEHPCPVGTYSNLEGLTRVEDCTPCLGGYACPLVGMIDVNDTYFCESGFFCKVGASSTTPNQGDDANICPEGSYCPLGTTNPEPCPKGTYSNSTGMEAEVDCILCPAGSYCDAVGLTEPSGLCTAGYFCVQSSNSSQMEICPVGSFCPEGSGDPTPCPTGTYSNTQGLQQEANCTLCNPGKFCNDTEIR